MVFFNLKILNDRLGDREEVRLGDIASTYSGGTPTSSNKGYYNGNINFIGSGEIGKLCTYKKITNEALNNSSSKMIEEGDLLYALYGATSGKVAISPLSGAINQAVLCIKCNKNIIHKNYLYQLLNFNRYRILKTYLQGGQRNLSANIINNLKLNIYNIIQQDEIAKFLSSIDILIEKQEEYIKQLENKNEYLIGQILTNNKYWKDYKLDDVTVRMVSGGTPRSTNEKYYNGNIPFLSISDITNEKLFITSKNITEQGLQNSSSKVVQKNNIIYTMYATPGIAFLTLIDVAIPQSVISVELKDEYNQYLVLKQLNFNRKKILKELKLI
ncbi:MAG: restriction endonuclease subunit S [Mycoplasmatales bacterium]